MTLRGWRAIVALACVGFAASGASARGRSEYTVRIGDISPTYADCILESSSQTARMFILSGKPESDLPKSWGTLYRGTCVFARSDSQRKMKINPDDVAAGRDPGQQIGSSISSKEMTIAMGEAFTPRLMPIDKRGWFNTIARLVENQYYLYFPAGLYRGALASALIRREFPTFMNADFKNAAPMIVPMPQRAAFDNDTLFADAANDALFTRLGDCMVRLDPAAAHALIVSEGLGPREKIAIAAAVGPMQACLPDGVKLQIWPQVIRGCAATAYYRLAHSLNLGNAVPIPAVRTN